MNKLLKDPLFHFLLIGAGLFLIFNVFNKSEDLENTIVISAADIAALQANFSRTWQRQPSEKELSGIIEESVRDEVAYREALAMGLDRDDPYVRRRMRMKTELLMEDIISMTPPTDEELNTFLVENRDQFKRQPEIAFSQIFFNAEKHGDSLESEINTIKQQLQSSQTDLSQDLGDVIMLPQNYPLAALNIIKRQFGEAFAEQIVTLEPEIWSGPVVSTYGLHLVLVRDRVDGYDPELTEIRPVVEREFMAKRRKHIKEEAYKKLQEQYEIVVETPLATAQ